MTSMFDQYNKTLRREDTPSTTGIPAVVTTSSGILSIRTTESQAMFKPFPMKFQPSPDIDHMAVSNNMLVVLMGTRLMRMRMPAKGQPTAEREWQDVRFLPAGVRVTKVFLDPTGAHLLLAVRLGQTPELWYMHRTMQEPRKCDRYRGHEVTAVAFNHANGSDASTSAILVGTSRGLLCETEMVCVDGDRKATPANWKQVFDIGKGELCPITGIEFHKVPNTMRHIILVTTMTRLYKFHEVLRVEEKSPYLHNIFNSYLNVPEEMSDFHEIPSSYERSCLRFNYDPATGYPRYFGWLTDKGILAGEIDPSSDTPEFIVTKEIIPLPGGGAAFIEEELVPQPYAATDSVVSASSSAINAAATHLPLTFVFTEFHALLLYKDHVTAISLLNYQTVYEEYFADEHGALLDIRQDQRSGRTYMSSRKSIFRFRINAEGRNVWRMYLDKNEYELARQHCQNAAQTDEVLVKQAERLFEQADYAQSATVYAQTRSSFEAVALRFLQIDEREPLQVFLRSRLESLRADEQMQITMLVVWMIELYLTGISGQSDNPARQRQLQKELQAFMTLPRVSECVSANRSVIYDLMASHGDSTNLTQLTTVNRDFEAVLNQHLNQGAFDEALSVLRSQDRAELYYKYAPIFMEEIPVQMGELLRSSRQLRLSAERLLPALVCLDTETQRDEVIKYLELSIYTNNCRSTAIHNYLVRLYAQYRPDKLMAYLSNQGNDRQSVMYDVQYALRVCLQYEAAREASVFLQCLLELWHPAVELALQFDPRLAQQTASRASDPAMQRKLWLRIVEHAVGRSNDVKQALQLLNECGGLLRIEDVLPFFSDFDRIDHFKEAICDALKQYNEEISHQRSEMDASAASANQVRDDLKTFRHRSVRIDAQQQCHTCSTGLLQRPFIMFPCGHNFHADCLEREVLTYLNANELRRFGQLKKRLAVPLVPENTNSTTTSTTNGPTEARLAERDQLQTEYETLLAAECLLCGQHMIESIDRPFVEDWESAANDWL